MLSFHELEEWTRDLHGTNSHADLAKYRADVDLVRQRLREALRHPMVQEALFLASPSLHERAAVWLEDPEREEALGIEAGLVRYFTRMASRSTPFGLFAGNSVGSVGHETVLRLQAAKDAVRHTRLDTEYLDAVIARLVAQPDIRAVLTFRTNTSLYEVGETIRYAEARLVQGRRAYFLVDVESHAHLRRALVVADNGATPDELARAISDEDVPIETARDFVDQLIDAQLLTVDLGPVITGRGAVEYLLDRLQRVAADCEPVANAVRVLSAVQGKLADFDAAGVGQLATEYRQLVSTARSLAEVSASRFVQVDVAKPMDALTVASNLVDELARGVDVLVDLFAYGRDDPLAEFRRAFEARYGERTIPLVEVLDEEMGIGYGAAQGPGTDPSPLLAGLPFPAEQEDETVGWGSRGRYLLWRVAETIEAGQDELVLDPREVARFRDPGAPRLPNAYHIMASLLAEDPNNSDAPRAVLDSAGGPSGARLLGRFCHVDDELQLRVREHLQAEEQLDPGVRFFELVHLPEGRVGNILARPLLRDLELEYLGTSGTSVGKRLRITDLTLSVAGGRVVLRSRRLGCEVRPRITSAHNTQWRSLGIYRFLSALQAEGHVEGVAWTWGPLESQPRLPRVRMGSLILSRARWNVPAPEMKELVATGPSIAERHGSFTRVQAWRAKRGLPRWIGLVDQDNVLTVDLDNPLSVASLLDALRSRKEATFQELHPGARSDAVTGPEGCFVNEVVIPMVRRAKSDVVPRAEPPHQSERRIGAFAPGSAWMSAKIYAGPGQCDALLTDVVETVSRKALATGVARRWFFLRYADPDWHLRVRWEGEPEPMAAELLPALHAALAPWLEDRRVHQLQLDTYQRETRRYGGPEAIGAAEDIFYHDSVMTTAFLALASGDDGLDARWRFALVAMDRHLDDFGLDLVAKRTLADRLAEMYGQEFRLDGPLRAKLRERYRAERKWLDQALDPGGSSETDGGPFALLRARSDASREAFAVLAQLEANGRLQTAVDEVLGSILHMHANRMLRTGQRAQEMVMFRFLEKTYASRLARQRGKRGT